MKRVLSIQHYPQFGGPHNEIIVLNDLFRNVGYETVVAIADEPGSARAAIEPYVEIHELPLDRLHGFRDLKALSRTSRRFAGDIKRLTMLMRSLDIDLVRVHGAHNPQGALAARIAGIPFVWVLSSDIGGPLMRTIAGAATPLIADSVLLTGRSLLPKYPGISRSKNVFTYNAPVNLSSFEPTDPSRHAVACAALGLDPTRPVIGTVASINPQKDPILFVKVAASAAQRNPDWQFVMIGGASERHQDLLNQVRQTIVEDGIKDRILLAGERRNIPDLLPAFDVMVLTSKFEGTPTTAAESLACEIPVVSCDVGAIGDLVESGESGYIVKRKIASFCEGLERIVSDPQLAKEMGRRGRNRVLGIAEAELSVQQQVRAYDWALRSRAGF